SPAVPNVTHLSNLQFFHWPLPLRSKNQLPVAGRKVPIFAVPVLFQSPATGKSPLLLGKLKQASTLQLTVMPSLLRSMPSPLRSKYRFGVRPEITSPIISTPDPVQSPTIGSEKAIEWTTLRSPHWPLPFKSRNHSPVDGRSTPIFENPLPVQSPTTGKIISPGLIPSCPLEPKGPKHRSTLQSSQIPLPFASRNH